MKLIRGIAIGIVVGILLLVWILPTGLFLYITKNTPAVAKVVPAQLRDVSVSSAASKKLTYFGYEFEVPWSDLDDSQTKVCDCANLQTVELRFQSGLKLFFAFRAKYSAEEYAMMKRVYEVAPDQIHYWEFCTSSSSRQRMLLLVAKSSFLQGVGLGSSSNPAESGIFNIESSYSEGFQYGDTRVRPDQIQLNLFVDDANAKIRILQAAYDEPAGVTQPELNRIIQSLHKATPEAVAASSN
jgi:hypothetical protein